MRASASGSIVSGPTNSTNAAREYRPRRSHLAQEKRTDLKGKSLAFISLILGPISVRSHHSYGNLCNTKVVREVP